MNKMFSMKKVLLTFDGLSISNLVRFLSSFVDVVPSVVVFDSFSPSSVVFEASMWL